MTTNTIKGALVTAGLILGFSAALVFAVRFDLITMDTQARAMGVVMGLVLMVSANTVPKMLKPLSEQQCEASQVQALQRFSGWALVLAGLGHAIAWLVLPMSVANGAAMSIVAGALLLVVIRCVAARRTSVQRQ